jgi:class 3 adenylate cyclase
MPGDERKLVTVLFADVAGSTELATRHDAEALRALLSAFFQEMRHRIEAFDGTVEKFAGDAVMAVFGVPTVHEESEESLC